VEAGLDTLLTVAVSVAKVRLEQPVVAEIS
jgi:hypothetical protein